MLTARGLGHSSGLGHRRRILDIIILAAQAGALIVFGFLIKPGSALYPPCPFHTLTGLHCPGCGTARGILRILGGDILGGLRQNLLLALTLPLLALADINIIFRVFGRKPPLPLENPPQPWGKLLPLAAAILIGAFWILRNIPVFPFTFLAPEALLRP